MSYNNVVLQERSIDFSRTFSALMRNVYSWMAGALAITALTAMVVAKDANILYAIASTPGLMWGLFIAELALVVILSARIMKMSFISAGVMFAVYAILNGVTMSFIFLVYTAESIAQTFFITAGTFAGMSLIGYLTKKDLSTFGRTLYMLLVGLVIATVVNMFMHNAGLTVILNYVGVIVFVGLTAYDTQKIKKMMIACGEAGVNDQTSKIALLGSLTLYLDFINLFLYLLRFLGKEK